MCRQCLVFLIEACRGCELTAKRREVFLLVLVGLVAGERPAVGMQEVRLVQFPDLVAEGVLDRVAALLAKAGNATPVVSFTVTYAVANVFLTLWGPLIVGIITKNAS